MTNRTQQNIVRLPGGSIDYAHYHDIGRRARQQAIHGMLLDLLDRLPRTGSTLAFVGLVAAVSFVPG